MTLMDAQDQLGRELQRKRDETKKVEQAKQDAKEEAKAEQSQQKTRHDIAKSSG